MSITIDERIPGMTDAQFENLAANAIRLATSGTPAQRAEAERLKPIIAAETEVRSARKTEARKEAAEKRKTTASAKRKAKKESIPVDELNASNDI